MCSSIEVSRGNIYLREGTLLGFLILAANDSLQAKRDPIMPIGLPDMP